MDGTFVCYTYDWMSEDLRRPDRAWWFYVVVTRRMNMHRRITILAASLALITIVAGAAWALEGPDFVAALDRAVADGSLSAEQALVYEFQYAFAPKELPTSWQPKSFAPLKCGTDLMRRYADLRPSLSAETVRMFDERLTPVASPSKAAYTSPLGHFTLTYATSGTDAVPSTDVDPANGVPDFVDRIAGYLDTSWETEIVDMGFTAPPTHPYPISFESMSYYGYTTVVSGTATRIVLHNTYQGFPNNDDPEGNAIGAAKVTCAHEFKHASQRAQSGWSEDGWVEVDATWMEDVVFDVVNDYYNYLPSGSGISDPALSLDDGGSGSYEDCIWQHWMSETYGEQVVVDLWDHRSTHTYQDMLDSYDDVLADYGSSLAEGHAAFTAWNFATGSRAVTGVGYGEASGYTTSSASYVSSYPYTTSGSSAHLAAAFYQLAGFSSSEDGYLNVQFDGADAGVMGLYAVIEKTDGSGVLESVPLDAAQDADYDLSVPLDEIASVGLIVSNNEDSGSARSWSLTVDKLIILPLPALTLDATSIELELDVADTAQRTLTVSSTGEAGSTLEYDVFLMSAAPSAALKSVSGSNVSCAQIEFSAGTTIDLDIEVYNASTDAEWLTDVDITVPAGVTVNSATSLTGGSAPLAFIGPVGAGVTANWHGNDGTWGALHGSETASGTVNVTFDAGLTGDLVFGWTVTGDDYGSTPHSLSGSFTLSASGPAVRVDQPNGGEIVAVGSTQDVLWTATEIDDVKIELSRDTGATWETVVASTINDGVESVTISGPASEQCLVRVGSLDGTTVDVSDAVFTIYDPVPWMTVDVASGDLAQGLDDLLTLDIDAAGLAVQDHVGYVVIYSNAATSPDVVPVTLTVLDPGVGVGDAPGAFALSGVYPNPFNPVTEVAFNLERGGRAVVDVLDLQGRVVRTLLSADLPAGPARVAWDGTDDVGRTVASGTYFARLRADGHTATVKMTLAK